MLDDMVFRKPHPVVLPDAFSVADAYRNGFTRSQMRNPALVSPFSGTRLHASSALGLIERCGALAARMPARTAVSHITAALLHGIPLPLSLTGERRVHVTTAGTAPVRRNGVVGHRSELTPADVAMVGAVPVTSPERTWCDLARFLSLPDLVACADFLLCWEHPRATRDGLAAAIARHPRTAKGRGLLETALALASERSRSRPESLVRVDLELAGFPAMSPNHPVRLSSGRRAEFDIAFVRYRVDLEYHGDHHRDQRQWRSDVARMNDIVDDGWDQLAFTGDDLARLATLRERVARRLRRRGWTGGG